MQLVIIHRNIHISHSRDNGLLHFALSNLPIADAILEGLAKWPWPLNSPKRTLIVFPKDWRFENIVKEKRIVSYTDNISIPQQILQKTGRQNWICISNGRFVTQITQELIEKMLSVVQADVVIANVTKELMAYNEKARTTGQGKLAGFRRLYSDSFELVPMPDDWPHCIFIRSNIFEQVLNDQGLPSHFPDFLTKCKSFSLAITSIKLGGQVLDLESGNGLLDFCSAILGSAVPVSNKKTIQKLIAENNLSNCENHSDDPKFIGRILFGKNIRIGHKAIVIGPTIIGDYVRIEDGAIITSSIIGPNVLVPANQVIQNRVIKGPEFNDADIADITRTGVFRQDLLCNHNIINKKFKHSTFHTWSRLSYARFFKRIIDILAASIAILLFLPFFPFIAAALKLSSSGPLFYKDKRQGLHGKVFSCIKLRTMIVGAGDMQDKLRVLNKVDGPQFKMDDDPRVSSVGRFLRATYIDEVPQFFNVLLGQMSVIGPRPSPESENELCPFWRYARLSVRPGITGLWQVCGTREQMRDFQEWIYYDVKYVNELSLKLDLWICYRTVIKIVKRFIRQL